MQVLATWIEIPVRDIQRAADFYGILFENDYSEINDDGMRKVVVLSDGSDGNPGVSLNETEDFEPGNRGVLVYFQAREHINAMLSRVEEAGGKVIIPRSAMGDSSFYAVFEDSEGNHLALSSQG